MNDQTPQPIELTAEQLDQVTGGKGHRHQSIEIEANIGGHH